MSAALRVDGVTVRRDGNVILDGITLDIAWGHITAVVGPNGAGKSTLLGVLAGDIHPDAGQIIVDNIPLKEYHGKQLARTRSMLTQDNTVTFPFTVHDVVTMGRNPWAGTPQAADDEQHVAEAITTVDMARFADRRYTHLSGGERARASFGRVLAQQTPLVLLDEPTAALDLKHQEAVLRTARSLCDAGKAVIVVLHDLTLAAAYADTVVMLSQGSVHSTGAPRDVFTAGALSSVYDVPIDVIEHPVSGALLIQPLR